MHTSAGVYVLFQKGIEAMPKTSGRLRPMTAIALFPPTRVEALARLSNFIPRAGRQYAERRNSDFGSDDRRNVSLLSPYLRHRLITEREVVAAVLARHSLDDADKYVQEVLWRTYWKGWLQLRPAIWAQYNAERDVVRASFRGARDLHRAESGMTGIDGFDDWARELVATGYLHNHARMWFASIWIFTLRLPWTLGADFFMSHLIDADPASNTLSWRWVAGLQTPGKTYLATADNIARHTDGRFVPKGLATTAVALTEPPMPVATALPELPEPARDVPALLLVTPEDMHPESVFAPAILFKGILVMSTTPSGGAASQAFVAGAAADSAERAQSYFNCPVRTMGTFDPDTIHAAAMDANVGTILTPCAPVGPTADALAATATTLQQSGIRLIQQRRPWDSRFWIHARKGFFNFKANIPQILTHELLGL